MDLSNSIQGQNLIPLNSFLTLANSICKIVTPFEKSSGFFIKFFKMDKNFYCLITNNTIITKKCSIKKKK